jgi:hypothetical protein
MSKQPDVSDLGIPAAGDDRLKRSEPPGTAGPSQFRKDRDPIGDRDQDHGVDP